jgi:hypothetical protein
LAERCLKGLALAGFDLQSGHFQNHEALAVVWMSGVPA